MRTFGRQHHDDRRGFLRPHLESVKISSLEVWRHWLHQLEVCTWSVAFSASFALWQHFGLLQNTWSQYRHHHHHHHHHHHPCGGATFSIDLNRDLCRSRTRGMEIWGRGDLGMVGNHVTRTVKCCRVTSNGTRGFPPKKGGTTSLRIELSTDFARFVYRESMCLVMVEWNSANCASILNFSNESKGGLRGRSEIQGGGTFGFLDVFFLGGWYQWYKWLNKNQLMHVWTEFNMNTNWFEVLGSLLSHPKKIIDFNKRKV